MFHIRLAQATDLTAIANIEINAAQRFLDTPYPQLASAPGLNQQTLHHALEQQLLWVAENANKVIGFALVQSIEDSNLAYLAELDIDYNAQNQGFGRRLLMQVLNELRQQQFISVYLISFRDVAFNVPWYQRIGFSIDNAFTHGRAKDFLQAQLKAEANAGFAMENRRVMKLDIRTLSHNNIHN